MNSDFNGDSVKDQQQQQSESDLQSPADVIGDEPDVVEMMDDDDDDDEDEEEEDDDADYHSVHNNSDHDHDQITELKIKSNLLLHHHHHHHHLDSVSNNNSNENLSSLRSSRHVSIDHESLRDTAGSHVNNNMESEGDEDAAAGAENEDRKRFQIELEFVQSLANPNYLNFLAQRGYFKSETFINYLKYLMYWKKPEYCKHLMYPQCLSLLEMLQHEKFLKEIVNAACSKYIDEQILLIWLHYKTRRDWIRIDPTKLPDNIEKLFQVESRLTNKDELDDDDDDDGSDDKESCFGSRDRIKKKYIHEEIDEDTSSNNNNNNNTRHNFNENRLSDNSNDPFLASLFIANEKF